MPNEDGYELVEAVKRGGISRREFVVRALGLGLSFGAVGSVLQACGGNTAESSAKNITLWHGWTGADNTEMLNNVLKSFDKQNGNGISVNPTPLEWDQLFSKLVISAASGRAPNVVMHHTAEIAEFATKGAIQPIGDLVEQAEIQFDGVPEAVIEDASWEGELYSVPGDLHPLGMYYNTDMVEQAGLDPARPPKTRGELMDWAEKLTVRGPDGEVSRYGIFLPSGADATPRWLWWSFMHQLGGSFLRAPGKSAVDSPESREALQFLVDVFHKYKVAAPGVVGGVTDPVAQKKAAIWFLGPWDVNLRLQQKLSFATAPIPTIGEQPAVWGTAHCQSIPRQRDDSAFQSGITFMDWFYTNYDQPAETVGVIPVNPVARRRLMEGNRAKYYQAFVDELDYVALDPRIPQYTTVFSYAKQTPISLNIEAALRQSKSVEQAIKDMKQGVDEQLARGA